VSLNIYDILGKKVRTLVNSNLPAGYHSAHWDGKSDTGIQVSSGLYICVLKGHQNSQKTKIILVK
ncbi:MAG TPA: T9SS type A sorting domain-containing protein, partial [bacterium]|nr:T9SS type A sorting domain-containing protein [bacterium]